jgi:hypothetical protein
VIYREYLVIHDNIKYFYFLLMMDNMMEIEQFVDLLSHFLVVVVFVAVNLIVHLNH